MSGHALDVLEFERVLERVARRASSEPGRANVRGLRPQTERETIVLELRRVAAAIDFIAERPEWGLGPIPDVSEPLNQLTVEGALLEPVAIHRIGVLLETSRLLGAELGSREPRPELSSLADRMVRLEELESAISKSVDAEGEVLTTASRELKRIRDGLRGAHSKIVRTLEKYLAGLPERFVVPDASVTIRDGRYVVPLRREGKGEVGGIVHDESQTGATLYVEPPVSLELMNRLRDLEREEAREIRRVLGALTERLAGHAHELRGALDALVDFDSLEARARAAHAWNAALPEIAEASASSGLRIRQGRHPLLLEAGEEPVVPFDLELEPEERALVVSGPNTGGKSVLLKATGLCAALAQSGVVPPVGPGTRLPVFRSFFADIGDEQSIARSLSTFSAHLGNIAEIVTQADEDSLVLIDEMGTGTDPAEGAAIARATLEELVSRGATTLVSSHLGEMKRLDTEGSGIVNASLQFDTERMEPTYRLVKGRPGRSFGIAIARRLGFPGSVLDRAERYREEGGAQLDDLLARLEQQEREVAELAAALDDERAETARLREDMETRERFLSDAERTAEERAAEEARRMLLDARAEVEEAIRELRGAAPDEASLEAAAREARRRVERAAARHRKPKRTEARTAAPAGGIGRGATVKIESTGAHGTVLELRDDRAVVEAGAIRFEVPLSDLTAEATGSSGAEAGRGGWSGYSGGSASSEIDLRGLRVDEMERSLEKAIDEAVVAGLGELRIIHGKGTGALRARAAEMLSADTRVSDFRSGVPAEGGAGVTIVTFR